MKFAPVKARASAWGNPDGTQQPIIRLHAGKSSVVIDYDDAPKLIRELEQLLLERAPEVRRHAHEA